MLFPAVDDHLLIRVYYQYLTQIAINDLHFRVQSTIGGGLSAQEIVHGMIVVVSPKLCDCLPDNAKVLGWSLVKLKAVRVPYGTGPRQKYHYFDSIEYTEADTNPGTVAAYPDATQISPLIAYTSTKDTPGKGQRCRLYMGFSPSTFYTASLVNSTGITKLSLFGAALRDGVTLDADDRETVIWGETLFYDSENNAVGNSLSTMTVRSRPSQQKRRSLLRKGDRVPFEF